MNDWTLCECPHCGHEEEAETAMLHDGFLVCAECGTHMEPVEDIEPIVEFLED